jgi:hypothetical protein
MPSPVLAFTLIALLPELGKMSRKQTINAVPRGASLAMTSAIRSKALGLA